MIASRSLRQAVSRPAPAKAAVRGRRAMTVMAKKNEVSESYARALVDLAEEKGKLEPIHADVDAMASLLKENAALRALLANPVVENEKKRAVLVKLGKDAGFQEYTNNFMNLLLEKDRLALLDEICESFEEFYCKLTDTQVAVVRSAVKLEQEQQFLIAKKLQELTGSKNIKLRPMIDSSLIAGFVVEYGSTQVDLSVRGQIEKVAEQLTTQMTAKLA